MAYTVREIDERDPLRKAQHEDVQPEATLR
jgi:hypothetical protein